VVYIVELNICQRTASKRNQSNLPVVTYYHFNKLTSQTKNTIKMGCAGSKAVTTVEGKTPEAEPAAKTEEITDVEDAAEDAAPAADEPAAAAEPEAAAES